MPENFLHIFAKAPVPGSVKTRLVSLLGEEGAAGLYKKMLHHVCATAASLELPDTRKLLWVAGDTDHPFLQDLCNEFALTACSQIGGDLGQRMLGSALNAFTQRASKVVIIGGDCVSIDADYLRQAFNVLDSSDMVLGPAEDGGYVLIGFTRINHEIFNDIKWGSSKAFEQTLHNARHTGLTCSILDTLWDVDRPEDVEKLRNTGIMSAL